LVLGLRTGVTSIGATHLRMGSRCWLSAPSLFEQIDANLIDRLVLSHLDLIFRRLDGGILQSNVSSPFDGGPSLGLGVTELIGWDDVVGHG